MDDTNEPKRRLPPPREGIERIFATVRERNCHGIHGSTRINDIERVRELLDEGTDVDALDVHGETALVWAGRYGRTEILRLLIEWGADLSPENTSAARALYGASICGHTETVRALLNAGVCVNAWCPAEHVDSAIPHGDGSVAFRYANHPGSTALHGAVLRHADVVRVLIEYGADVNATDGMGRTPWQISSHARKYAAIREMLKSAGATESLAASGLTTKPADHP